MTDLADQLRTELLKAQVAQARQKAGPGPQPDAQGVVTLEDGSRMVLDPATGSYTSAELMANNRQPGLGASALAGAAQGFTFGWGDELAGALGADPMTVERGRAEMLAASRDHPVGYIGGAIGGGVAAAAPAARLMPSMAGASILTRMGAGALAGAGLGAAQGAGEAMAGQRVAGAAKGALLGGAVGAAAPALAAGLRSGSVSVLNYLKRVDLSGIQKALGIGPDAAKVVRAHLANDDFKAAADAMDKAGPDAMLADSSPQASQLLDTTIAAGGPAQRVAREAVETRSAAAATGLRRTMDTILGAPDGVKGVARDIATRTSAARSAAYDKAYGTAINYADQTGKAIEDVLARVPSAKLKEAVQAANDAMQMQGIKNRQIMAEIGKDGSVVFSEMPNVQQLDYLKRQLGELAAAAVDQFGRPTGLGRDLNTLAGQLKDAVANAVPDYRAAVKLGGDKIAEDKALKLGRDFMKPSVTREDVAAAAKGLSVEARIAAKKGMRAALDDAMASVKTVASDLNGDARQALNVVKQLSSDANRTKAEALLGKTAAGALFREFDQAATQLALRTATARNSATAARTAGKEAIDKIISGGPLNAIKRGKVAEWGRGLVQMMTKTTPADDLEKMQAVYAEVAKALTEARGTQAKQALVAVHNAMKGIPATKAQADMVAKAVTTALAFGSGHTLQRSRSTPSGVTPQLPR